MPQHYLDSGRIFVDADGTEFLVTWFPHRDAIAPREIGRSVEQLEERTLKSYDLHLVRMADIRRGRSYREG